MKSSKQHQVCQLLLLLMFLLWIERGQCQDDKDKSETESCPYFCVCHATDVYCDKTGINQIPKKIPPKTKNLVLKDNIIRRVKNHRLQFLSEVTTVNLKGNKIYYIQNTAFSNMTNLRALTLRENRLKYLPSDVFKGLTYLKQLSLRKNKLRTIEGLFEGLKNLELLSLGENKIKFIADKTFDTNLHLRILDLHNNSIFFIQKESFQPLPYLKYLILRDNPLKHVDLDFRMNFHLELMDFTNCKLKEMVRGLPLSIRDLRMAENHITTLRNTDLEKTRKIRMLMLNDNRISKIENNTFAKLWMLHDLHIANNSLTRIPWKMPKSLAGLYASNNSIIKVENTNFRWTPNLEFVTLNLNNIRSIGARSFKDLKKLKSLDLSSNLIEFLPPAGFRNAKSLELLDLSHNPILEAEHNCFSGLENLHILQLSSVSNETKVKPSIFKDTRHLLFLDLSNSSQVARHLAENPYSLNYIRSVEDLNLIQDDLYSLPADFPKHFPNLKMVKLVGNPWHCDSSIMWMAKWMRNSTVEFFSSKHVTCASPPELRGRKIKELEDEDVPTIAPVIPHFSPKVNVIDIPVHHGKNLSKEMSENKPGENTNNVPNNLVSPEKPVVKVPPGKDWSQEVVPEKPISKDKTKQENQVLISRGVRVNKINPKHHQKDSPEIDEIIVHKEHVRVKPRKIIVPVRIYSEAMFSSGATDDNIERTSSGQIDETF